MISFNSVNNVDLKVFSGSSHPELGQEIAAYLDIKLGQIKTSQFACGETYGRILENVRGDACFVIQSATDHVNNDVMELLIIVDALKRASARHVNVVLPLYPYSRQDKKSAPREPISARLVADLIQVAGADRVITMDLHSDQIQGFYNIPVDHLTAIPLFAKYLKDLNIPNAVVVAPDTGRAKTSKKIADRLGVPLAILHKGRPDHNQAEIMHVVGEVKDKNVIMVDDMIDTAGSVSRGAEALLAQGANSGIYMVATHAIFSPPAVEKLNNPKVFKQIIVTNSTPITKEKKFPALKVLSAAPLLAEAIRRNYQRESISELFD